MIQPLILTECYADQMLVKAIGYEPVETHEGNSGIVNLLCDKKREFYGKRAVCIIDADKRMPEHFTTIKLRHQSTKSNISIHKIPNTLHHVIILKPAIEKWLLEAGEAVGVKPENHKLPKDFAQFRNMLKDQQIRKNNDFKNYLNAIHEKQKKVKGHFGALRIYIEDALKDPSKKKRK
ncbi:MAG: hypothetical protein ACK5Z2_11660 [Bacteroidota bacterium]|jgi:hypothetical protein